MEVTYLCLLVRWEDDYLRSRRFYADESPTVTQTRHATESVTRLHLCIVQITGTLKSDHMIQCYVLPLSSIIRDVVIKTFHCCVPTRSYR